MLRTASLLVFLTTLPLILAQAPTPLAKDATTAIAPDKQVQEQIDGLTRELRQYVDWNREYAMIERATHTLWEQNRWTSESDLYAKSLLLEIERIPPWETTRRIDLLSQMVAERYGLAARDAARLKSRVYLELIKLLPKHAPELMRVTNEYFEARSQGKPLTAEMIARWSGQTEEFLPELTQSTDALAELVGQLVSDEYKDRYLRDFDSYQRRMTAFEQLNQAWADGKWKPEDWGMENDPIQLQNTPADPFGPGFTLEQRSALLNLQIRAAPHLEYEPSTWERYVRTFARLYDFTPAQTQTAESILLELLSRAASYTRTHAEELARVPEPQRSNEPCYQPLRSMFEELKERIGRIPTMAQRRAVESQHIIGE